MGIYVLTMCSFGTLSRSNYSRLYGNFNMQRDLTS